MREDNYIGFFNLSSVHITGLGSSSFSFMNCDPCAVDRVMHLSGFPWYKCNKKLQTFGIVSLQCKKICWLDNLSSCNESLNLLLLVGLVLLVTVCICSDNNDSFSFATKFYLLFCRS